MDTFRFNRYVTRYDGTPVTVFAPSFVTPRTGLGGRRSLRRYPLAIDIGRGAGRGDQPLISCLMVTKDRLQLAKLAVGSYRRQTWRRKELVVIDSSADDRLVDWLRVIGDRTINVIHMPGCTLSLGDLRNLSVEKASGDLICQWDDDDMQHPCRLEAAAAVMAATRTKACLLFREIVWFVSTKRFAVASKRPHENTILCEKAVLPRYPSLARGEDTPAIHALMETHTVALLDMPELYVYVSHGTNTCDDPHMERIWNGASVQMSGSDYEATFSELSRSYPLDAYLKAVRRG